MTHYLGYKNTVDAGWQGSILFADATNQLYLFLLNMTHYLGRYKMRSAQADMGHYFLQMQSNYFSIKHDT